MCGLRVGIGGFVHTLAKTLVDPMLDAGNWASKRTSESMIEW